MTSEAFFDLLSARGERAGIPIPTEARGQLWTYVRLLSQWNKTINLTALALSPLTSETVDRLLIEPIAAARMAGTFSGSWVDVGSGGGSPAIPFKIVQPEAVLTMVESRTRKAVFLREVVRTLELSGASVVEDRFEKFAMSFPPQTVDLITVRAVRIDEELSQSARRLLTSGGRLFLFHSKTSVSEAPAGFLAESQVSLATEGEGQLSIFRPMFHVEHSD